jgi:hypothetical protein
LRRFLRQVWCKPQISLPKWIVRWTTHEQWRPTAPLLVLIVDIFIFSRQWLRLTWICPKRTRCFVLSLCPLARMCWCPPIRYCVPHYDCRFSFSRFSHTSRHIYALGTEGFPQKFSFLWNMVQRDNLVVCLWWIFRPFPMAMLLKIPSILKGLTIRYEISPQHLPFFSRDLALPRKSFLQNNGECSLPDCDYLLSTTKIL